MYHYSTRLFTLQCVGPHVEFWPLFRPTVNQLVTLHNGTTHSINIHSLTYLESPQLPCGIFCVSVMLQSCAAAGCDSQRYYY